MRPLLLMGSRPHRLCAIRRGISLAGPEMEREHEGTVDCVPCMAFPFLCS